MTDSVFITFPMPTSFAIINLKKFPSFFYFNHFLEKFKLMESRSIKYLRKGMKCFSLVN